MDPHGIEPGGRPRGPGRRPGSDPSRVARKVLSPSYKTHVPVANEARQAVEEGFLFLTQRDYLQAVACCNASIAVQPNAEAYTLRSIAHDFLGNARAASRDRASALKHEPGYPKALYYEAVERIRLGRFGSGLEVLEQICAREPSLIEDAKEDGAFDALRPSDERLNFIAPEGWAQSALTADMARFARLTGGSYDLDQGTLDRLDEREGGTPVYGLSKVPRPGTDQTDLVFIPYGDAGGHFEIEFPAWLDLKTLRVTDAGSPDPQSDRPARLVDQSGNGVELTATLREGKSAYAVHAFQPGDAGKRQVLTPEMARQLVLNSVLDRSSDFEARWGPVLTEFARGRTSENWF